MAHVSVYQLPNRVQVLCEAGGETFAPRFAPESQILSLTSCSDVEYHGNGVYLVTVDIEKASSLGYSDPTEFALDMGAACAIQHHRAYALRARKVREASAGVRLREGYIRVHHSVFFDLEYDSSGYWEINRDVPNPSSFDALAVIIPWNPKDGAPSIYDWDEVHAEMFETELQAHEWWGGSDLQIWETL